MSHSSKGFIENPPKVTKSDTTRGEERVEDFTQKTGEVTMPSDLSTNSRNDDDSRGHASVVAAHYNTLEERGLAERSKSRIFYLRNFNNWVKSMMINEYLNKIRQVKPHGAPVRVMDMCCGKGGDLLKWRRGNISHLVCADIAEVSVEQCQVRYNELLNRCRHERGFAPVFSAEFIPADCTKVRLREKYKDASMELDLVSCQFSFHYCFESITQAECMLRNAAECLRPGGFFIGTIPDAFEIVKLFLAELEKEMERVTEAEKEMEQDNNNQQNHKIGYHPLIKMQESPALVRQGILCTKTSNLEVTPRCKEFNAARRPWVEDYILHNRLQKSGKSTFGNEIYQVEFQCDTSSALPLFGAKYNFHLEGVVDCPEFLVHFPTLIKLAEKYGLQLTAKDRFQDYYEKLKEEGRSLLGKMQALETYPPFHDAPLLGKVPEDYDHVQQYMNKSTGHRKVGTLSQSEWEAASLYLVFAFQKSKVRWNAEGKPEYEEKSAGASGTSGRKHTTEEISEGPAPKRLNSTDLTVQGGGDAS
ncbi:hypothetical protein C0J52_15143 [Blattella germanica]|nr:hypothetical protein C0J52_15143 [Blattella germanica]